MDKNNMENVKPICFCNQDEADILTAAIAPWVFQNNIDLESKEFNERLEDIFCIRDRILTAIQNLPDY